MHVEEQPSPFIVFPSSHASYGNIIFPSPHKVEQSPLACLGRVYPPHSQVIGQLKHKLFILTYPEEHTEHAVRFTHVWQPNIGQVEHLPV